MFVEEINHALHAALQFRNGEREIASEDFARNLELQARVDTYLVLLLFVAFFRKTQRVSRTDRRWLRFHLFEAQNPGAFRTKICAAAISKRPSWPRATPISSTRSTACGGSRRSGTFARSNTGRKRAASSP